jgi:uncharacterized protein with GYD domain
MPFVGDQVYPEAWPALVQDPEDRREAIPSVVEGLGGTIHGAWLTFGEYDTVLILELPDNVAGAVTSIAFASGGAWKDVKTTPLLRWEAGLEAMRGHRTQASATGLLGT